SPPARNQEARRPLPAGSLFFCLETEACSEADVAAGERRKILEVARVATSVHVEQVVAGQRQRELGILSERMPIERRIDHRVAGRRGLVWRSIALTRHSLDLDAAVDLAARAGEAGKHSERRDFGRIAEALDLRPHRVGDQFATPLDAERLAELDIAFGLEAII